MALLEKLLLGPWFFKGPFQCPAQSLAHISDAD